LSETDAKRFLANSDDCRRRAEEASSEHDRTAWEMLAAEWDGLAKAARHRRGIFERYE